MTKRTASAHRLQPKLFDRIRTTLSDRRLGGRRSRVVRRALAITLLVAAGALALYRPAELGIRTLTVSRDLPVGAVLTEDDLAEATLRAPPAGAIADRTTLIGRALTGPMRRGEVFTDARVDLGGGLQPGPGRVAVPVRLADPGTVALLRAGQRVTLLGGGDGAPAVLTRGAVVLTVPEPRPAGPDAGSRPMVVLAVGEPDADRVAVAALREEVAIRFG